VQSPLVGQVDGVENTAEGEWSERLGEQRPVEVNVEVAAEGHEGHEGADVDGKEGEHTHEVGEVGREGHVKDDTKRRDHLHEVASWEVWAPLRLATAGDGASTPCDGRAGEEQTCTSDSKIFDFTPIFFTFLKALEKQPNFPPFLEEHHLVDMQLLNTSKQLTTRFSLAPVSGYFSNFTSSHS
jgi:hypothetical protein